MFATFFSDKIHKLRFNLLSDPSHVSPHITPHHSPTIINHFDTVTHEEIYKLISDSSDTFCDLDPIPTSLLKKCAQVLVPTITKIINLSLSTGICPDHFKSSLVYLISIRRNLVTTWSQDHWATRPLGDKDRV